MSYLHIGCCIDDSPAVERALAHAVRLARDGGGRLTLVHVAPHPLLVESVGGREVVSPRDINATERAWLTARADAVAGAEAALLEGQPGPEICRWAQEQGVDLLICARHHGGWSAAVGGSVARHLVDHAPCPVLVIRGEGGAEPEALP